MNAATASPRPGSLVAATDANAGVAIPIPSPMPPPIAIDTPQIRMARTRSRAFHMTTTRIAVPTRNMGSHSASTHGLRRKSRSTRLDCEIVVVASSTPVGTFFANAGLIVSSAVRMVAAAWDESTSTRRAPCTWKTCSWARSTKS